MNETVNNYFKVSARGIHAIFFFDQGDAVDMQRAIDHARRCVRDNQLPPKRMNAQLSVWKALPTDFPEVLEIGCPSPSPTLTAIGDIPMG